MGEVSRRAVLGAGAGTLGLLAMGVGEPAAGAVTKKSAPALVRADYAALVGRVFTADHAGHSYRLRLTHIHDLAPTTARQRPHCFSLVFAPVGHARLRDGIYTLRRKRAATHKLFLSSLGSNRQMQAIVNRST
jgi:hypothetical protein